MNRFNTWLALKDIFSSSTNDILQNCQNLLNFEKTTFKWPNFAKVMINTKMCTSSVFLFFIFPPLYVMLIWANHLQRHYHRPKYVFINHFWRLRLHTLFIYKKKSCFNFQPCWCHPWCFINCHRKCISKRYEKYLFLTHLRKHSTPNRLLGVKCTTCNNSIHTGYLCMHLIFQSIIIDLLIPSPAHNYKIRIVIGGKLLAHMIWIHWYYELVTLLIIY
jgi:hypothetical protein